MTNIRKKHISAHTFRRIQDQVLGVDNLDMARLLGLKLDKRKNAIRQVERMRNGQKDISGTTGTLLWFVLNARAMPPWIGNGLAERVLEAARG